ncbi:hypothetical protein [Streptomyces sp. NPDC002520]
MGIRMLHRRTPEAHKATAAWADTASDRVTHASPVPPLAADASTARIPADPAATMRRATVDLRRRLTDRTYHAPDWRAWTDLARGYLALLLALIPKARPRRTLTVFVASLTERPVRPAAHRSPRPDAAGFHDPKGNLDAQDSRDRP